MGCGLMRLGEALGEGGRVLDPWGLWCVGVGSLKERAVGGSGLFGEMWGSGSVGRL